MTQRSTQSAAKRAKTEAVPQREALTALEFFGRKLQDASLMDAHYDERISENTLREYVAGRRGLAVDTAKLLQEWSLKLPHADKVYISAALTLGLVAEPS